MDKWIEVGVVIEGSPIDLQGLNPWDFKWEPVATPPVELPHPSYPKQLHSFSICKLKTRDQTVLFAATELSANVWGFYLPSS